MFRIYEVPADAAAGAEQLGTKPKFWFNHNDLGHCLCKLARKGTGEDWSEKVAAEIAGLLGIPCATYELATFRGDRCVISPSFVPEGAKLTLGNELILARNPKYEDAPSKFRQSAHTVDVVLSALRASGSGPPQGAEPHPPLTSPVSVFIGYLMLDTLIGNTDRHHENWGVIEHHDGRPSLLAPTFDHASCLGRHLQESDRKQRLESRDTGNRVEAYAEKARSALYGPGATKPFTTLDAFRFAACQDRGAAREWVRRVAGLREDPLRRCLEPVPSECMPPNALQFALRMMLHNRTRLLALDLDS